MAKAETTEVFDCTPEQFFKIVSDYGKYPDFLSEVKNCVVLKTEGNKKLVEYTVNVVKNFKYTLWMQETPNEEVKWEFASGDLFKTSKGFWKLKEEGGKCRATYCVDAEFTLFVPGPIAKALVSVNLPNMMSAYHKRVKEVYGR
jgi:ribosome-associated toxin RatA of RatAB toxin-antitoxin module